MTNFSTSTAGKKHKVESLFEPLNLSLQMDFFGYFYGEISPKPKVLIKHDTIVAIWTKGKKKKMVLLDHHFPN